MHQRDQPGLKIVGIKTKRYRFECRGCGRFSKPCPRCKYPNCRHCSLSGRCRICQHRLPNYGKK